MTTNDMQPLEQPGGLASTAPARLTDGVMAATVMVDLLVDFET